MGFAQSMGGQHWAKNGLAAWRHTQHTLPTPAHLVVHTSDAVSYTHLTLPTNNPWCRSRWSPYH